MNKRIWNIPLLFGFLIPMVLLFWPFAYWGSTASLLLRVIAAACIQLLLCRNARSRTVFFLPLLLCTLGALWGLFLYHTSPDWTCSFGEFVKDYVSPAISCAACCWLYWKFQKPQTQRPA